MTIKVETIVNYSESRTEAETITNTAYAELLANKVATTSEITHIIEANTSDNNNGNNGNNKIDNNDIAKGTAIITGTAWVDEDGNGQKGDNEKSLSGIKVRLYNTETNNLVKDANGNTLEATTNDNGVYVLNNIGNGKYIAVFDYNRSEYGLTKYKVSGATADKTSSAILKKLTINGNEQEIASTDILDVNNANVSDINIGLIKLQDFSFKLDKFVNKVTEITFSGVVAGKNNKDVLYVTERAVFALKADGVHLIEVAPGVDVKTQVLDQMDFEPIVDRDENGNVKLMDARIFTDEVMGMTIE